MNVANLNLLEIKLAGKNGEERNAMFFKTDVVEEIMGDEMPYYGECDYMALVCCEGKFQWVAISDYPSGGVSWEFVSEPVDGVPDICTDEQAERLLLTHIELRKGAGEV